MRKQKNPSTKAQSVGEEKGPRKAGKFVDTVKCAPNDVSWYASNPQLVKDAGSFSFNNPVGGVVNLDNGGLYNTQFAVPGVMAIRTVGVPGCSRDLTSPLNIAARNIYSFVRHANSGHANYDAPDLMMYLLAMDNVYSMLSFMSRAYGVVSYYQSRNRYVPKALFNAMHLDYEDFMENIADFRAFINVYAVKVGSYCVPKSMSYFTRHMWMYTNVYKDSESDKAQLYLYTPAFFYQFSATASTQGGSLEPVFMDGAASSKLMTFEELRTKANGLIQALMYDEDANIISGDVLKAFTSEGVFKLGPITEDYVVEPVYNEEVLHQINNVTLLGAYSKAQAESWKITQQTTGDQAGGILFAPIWEADTLSTPWANMPLVFNSYKKDPGPEDTLVGSRLTVAQWQGSESRYTIHDCGSDVALTAEVYRMVAGSNNRWDVVTPPYATVYTKWMFVEVGAVDAAALCSQIAQLENFDWHPPIQYAVLTTNTSGGVTAVDMPMPCQDMDNYTVFTFRDLAKLHETALLSQFSVPQMGAWNDKLV